MIGHLATPADTLAEADRIYTVLQGDDRCHVCRRSTAGRIDEDRYIRECTWWECKGTREVIPLERLTSMGASRAGPWMKQQRLRAAMRGRRPRLPHLSPVPPVHHLLW